MEFTKSELFALLNQPGGLYLRGADLTGANLRGANLRGADLREADLTGANLEGADLTGALMQGAQLAQANMKDANLNRAVLNTAKYRDSTIWPANFPPAVTGAKKETTFTVKLVHPKSQQEAEAIKKSQGKMADAAIDGAIARIKAAPKPVRRNQQHHGHNRPLR